MSTGKTGYPQVSQDIHS